MNKRQKLRLDRVCRWIAHGTKHLTEEIVRPHFYEGASCPADIDLRVSARATITDLEIESNPTQKALRRLVLIRLEDAIFAIRDCANEQIRELEVTRRQFYENKSS